MISRIFLDIILTKYNIQNFSECHSIEKPPKKLLEQVRYVIRLKHYSYKTEKSYIKPRPDRKLEF